MSQIQELMQNDELIRITWCSQTTLGVDFRGFSVILDTFLWLFTLSFQELISWVSEPPLKMYVLDSAGKDKLSIFSM